MAEITASAVAKLREMTNAGMMDCKKALTESQGNLDAAIDLLRKRGAATATSKGAREAREGVIAQYIAPGGRLAVTGISTTQAEQVAAFLRPLQVHSHRTAAEWSSLVLTRGAGSAAPTGSVTAGRCARPAH